jgi:hypothetical protein
MITSINSFLEANLYIAIVIINAVLIYNKYVLKSDGHKVYWVWGWWGDYQIIKTITKYKNLKRLLYANFLYLAGILVLGVLTNAFK